MAFEATLNAAPGRSRRARGLTYALSLLVHGGAIAAALLWSVWHVPELSPPAVTVTFISGAPPAPPPPPPPTGNGAKRKPAQKTKPAITPTEIVQPREHVPRKKEIPRDEPDEEDPGATFGQGSGKGVAGGVPGGTEGGVVGGTLGGTGTGPPAPVAPKMLPPHLGALQKVSGPEPVLPALLGRSNAEYLVIAKICVSRTGTVDGVTLLKRAAAMLDANVETAVKAWRFRPLMAGGTPVPFCYVGRFEFRSE